MALLGDFTNTNAFFWDTILDLSQYAGTDAGYTPFYIEALDAAGKKATGYIGAVGAGETLSGTELVTNGTMELDSDWTNFGSPTTNERSNEQAHAGMYSHKLIGNSAGDGMVGAVFTAINGAFYKRKAWVYISALTATSNGIDIVNSEFTRLGGLSQITALTTWTESVGYFNATFTSLQPRSYQVGEGAITSYTDDYSVQRVTDPPATAVHIVSSLNGTTRDWASIESGFDPNNIASYNIIGTDNIVFQDGDVQNFMLTTAQTMTGGVGNIVTESNSNAGMMEINIPEKAGYPRGRIVNA